MKMYFFYQISVFIIFTRTSVVSRFQNEDMEERRNSENIELETAHNTETNGILFHRSPEDISDVELSSDISPTDAQRNFNLHSSPHTDSIPQPLFTDVELFDCKQNTAFFIEDSENTDLYVQKGGFTKRTLPCSQELKVLTYPLFYCGLILTATTKMSLLSFWILLPLLLKSRLQDFQFYQAATLLSTGGFANFCSTVGSHWLPTVSPWHRKFVFIIMSYIAAGGLYSKFFRHCTLSQNSHTTKSMKKE